jgi:hypothetical protein
MIGKAHMLGNFRASFIRLEHFGFHFFDNFVYRIGVEALKLFKKTIKHHPIHKGINFARNTAREHVYAF